MYACSAARDIFQPLLDSQLVIIQPATVPVMKESKVNVWYKFSSESGPKPVT